MVQPIPKKRATRVGGNTLSKPLIRGIATAIFAFLVFYKTLPAINLHNPGFYVFFLLVCGFYCLMCVFTGGFTAVKVSNGQTTVELKDKTAVWKKVKWPLIACGALAVFLIVGALLGSVVFRSHAYTNLMTVEQGDFAADVDEISYDRIPMLDSDSAARLGNRKLGELADMVSQFEVDDYYYQINYQGSPVRVAILRYGDFFKWLSNHGNGISAYIRINMVSQNAEVVRLQQGMKYTTADRFGRYLYRLLRFRYPTYLFSSANFEIDEAGQPWYICPRETRTIGLFGGTDVIGAVLVNAVTGESTYYDKADIPAWVDRVFSADLIIRQYDYHGLYQNGYLNSLFGQKGCTQTTDGYNYIALNDDVYVYTGVTSVGGDESNIGFLLCNQRTKETRYYPCAGAEEFSAMDSAQGVVQHLHYVSTFPLLLNIGGQPTYFIPLKDDAALVKMYAMVNVQQYNIVATGATVAECERAYQRLLRQENLTDGSDAAPVDGVLTEIRSAVIDGTSWYYLRLQGERTFYTVSARDCETVIILSVGDRIRILGAADEGSIRKAESVELLP